MMSSWWTQPGPAPFSYRPRAFPSICRLGAAATTRRPARAADLADLLGAPPDAPDLVPAWEAAQAALDLGPVPASVGPDIGL
jgi:hypothetical protein